MSKNQAREAVLDIHFSLQPEIFQSLMAKDKWYGEKDLGMRVGNANNISVTFGDIKQPWLKDAIKRHALYMRVQRKSFGTLMKAVEALRVFAKFLDSQHVNRFNDISTEIIELYASSLSKFSVCTKKNRLGAVKNFLNTGDINGWFKAPVSTYFLNEITKCTPPKIEEINYIPDEVLRQLDEHLHLLPEPVQRMLVLLRALGLRGGELLQMRFDCLRQRRDGLWEIHFTNWKFHEQTDVLPINEALVTVIKEQQEYVRKHLGEDFPYLFCANMKAGNACKGKLFNFRPSPRAMKISSVARYLNILAAHCDICNVSGERWHFKSHQFRKTVATKMTNEGVRQYVIQMYLRPRNPDMMQHYAFVFPSTMKDEINALHKQKKIVNIAGAEVEILHPELNDDVGLQWLRSKMQPKALAMGFCARPALQKPCPHANACMSCKHYRLDEDDLPAIRKHLDSTRKLKAESERLNYVRQIKGIEQDEATLTNLIKSLESESA